MSVTKTVNTSNLDKIMKEIKYLQTHGVRVGIFGEKGNKENNGVKIIEYATYLIVGTSTMPPRDFMQHSIKGKLGRLALARYQKKVLKDVHKGILTGKEALEQIGIEAVQMIKDSISSNDFIPLAESTLKMKANSRNANNILRDTDQLLDSVTFTIERL